MCQLCMAVSKSSAPSYISVAVLSLLVEIMVHAGLQAEKLNNFNSWNIYNNCEIWEEGCKNETTNKIIKYKCKNM